MVCFRQIIKKQASETKKMKYFQAPTCIKKIKDRYLQTNSTKWSYSSAGSEHLPYKQGVLGSNPSGTTKTTSYEVVFFYFTAKPSELVAREEISDEIWNCLNLNKHLKSIYQSNFIVMGNVIHRISMTFYNSIIRHSKLL